MYIFFASNKLKEQLTSFIIFLRCWIPLLIFFIVLRFSKKDDIPTCRDRQSLRDENTRSVTWYVAVAYMCRLFGFLSFFPQSLCGWRVYSWQTTKQENQQIKPEAKAQQPRYFSLWKQPSNCKKINILHFTSKVVKDSLMEETSSWRELMSNNDSIRLKANGTATMDLRKRSAGPSWEMSPANNLSFSSSSVVGAIFNRVRRSSGGSSLPDKILK